MRHSSIKNTSRQESTSTAESYDVVIRYVKLLLTSAVLGAGVLYSLDGFNHSMNPNTPPTSLGQHFE